MRRRWVATTCLGACVALSPSCAWLQATPTTPTRLETPEPPARAVVPPTVEPSAAAPEPVVSPPPMPSPRATRQPPSRPPAERPEPVPPAAPTPEPAPTPTVEPPPGAALQTSADAEAAERRVRALMVRASQDLQRIDYRELSRAGKTQYDTARRFLDQAEEAIKARNLVFASQLADKAAGIAAGLRRQ